MRRLAVGIVLAAASASVAASSGCVVDELTAPHAQPGGAVHAALAGGADHVCPALGEPKRDPLTVNGFSTVLTFGLSAHADLSKAGATVDVAIVRGGDQQLEIHLDGSGCVADDGTVHLAVDPTGALLEGAFSATGHVSSMTTACAFSGTFVDVPLDR